MDNTNNIENTQTLFVESDIESLLNNINITEINQSLFVESDIQSLSDNTNNIENTQIFVESDIQDLLNITNNTAPSMYNTSGKNSSNPSIIHHHLRLQACP